MKILIYEDKRFYWKEKDFQTQYGVLKEKDIKKAKSGTFIKTHLNKKFLVLDALFIDEIKKIKRGPAIILPKDIGLILTLTGINKESTCLEAGSGSGYLTAYLANFCKKIYSYERKKEFYKLTKKNLEFLNIKNVILKNKDVYKKIEEKNLDLIVLDLPEPWNALSNVKKSLKSSHFLVCYLPTITQVIKLTKSLNGFIHEKTLELIEREWQTDLRRLRPKSQIIGHTGFIIFLRKI